MVVKSHGFRSRSRKILSRHPRERGKIPITPRLIDYQPGDYVDIIINPAVHKGMPHRRFHGKTGRIIGKRGRAYIVEVRDGGKIKTLIVRPDHLRPSKSVKKRVFSYAFRAS